MMHRLVIVPVALGATIAALSCDSSNTPLAPTPPAPYCTPKSGTNLKLTKIVDGLELPVFVTAPAGDSRLFILEQPGRIRILKDGALLPTPFLDFDDVTVPVADRLNASGDERGLLGLAFHPDYKTNGRFFVHYTSSQNIIVAEYTAEPAADTASTTGKILIRESHIRDNHNGGTVAFGPDGFLYASIGDGGGANDSEEGGQNTEKLLGKILRIDVNSGDPYGIPDGNPWKSGGGVPEMFAWGLRNPYRFSIDPQTRHMFIGDVGQGVWEEVSVVPNLTPGLNFGWPVFEGPDCFDDDTDGDEGCDSPGDYVAPTYAYDQRESADPANPCSVVGGVVYRGTCMPDVVGEYFFGDYCTGYIKSFTFKSGEQPDIDDRSDDLNTDNLTRSNLSSFGTDGFGELYVTALGKDPLDSGTVYRVEVE